MSGVTVCKIVRQYNKEPVSAENMQKLQDIAADYSKVKNYVYRHYGGIRSLSKLYPGYTVQNEMTGSGLRERLGLPAVYFYLAVFDALRDIKSQWSNTKAMVLERVNANSGMTEEEKHFVRYLLKVSNAFDAVLNGQPMELPAELRRKYDALSAGVNVRKLENYLRRQVRRYPVKLNAGASDGFAIAERAYRYADHGIYISVKEKRQRIFIPLTDNNRYARQLYVRLYPEQRNVELLVPVDVAVKRHADYVRTVGVSMGMYTMLTTDEGNTYGEELGVYQTRLSDWLREQTGVYQRNRAANPGRKKYQAKKNRMEEQLHSYINRELNRFLRTEKPNIVYLPGLSGTKTQGPVKKINYHVSTWQQGYIRGRLEQKCQEQSVKLVRVYGKDIGSICSECKGAGIGGGRRFVCSICGYEADRKMNAARNVKRRGETDHRDQTPDK